MNLEDTGPIVLSLLSGALAGDLVGTLRIQFEERKLKDNDTTTDE